MGIGENLKKGLGYLLSVIGYGSGASVCSYLYEQDLSVYGRSITGRGFPLSWWKEGSIVYPNSPITYSFSPENFVIDIAFWSLLIGAPYVIHKGIHKGIQWYRTRK